MNDPLRSLSYSHANHQDLHRNEVEKSEVSEEEYARAYEENGKEDEGEYEDEDEDEHEDEDENGSESSKDDEVDDENSNDLEMGVSNQEGKTQESQEQAFVDFSSVYDLSLIHI